MSSSPGSASGAPDAPVSATSADSVFPSYGTRDAESEGASAAVAATDAAHKPPPSTKSGVRLARGAGAAGAGFDITSGVAISVPERRS